MSDSDKAGFPDFGKLVPGFDFLQNLTRQATAGASSGVPKLPQLGGWVAPTMNVEELDKRISELKTVQFWLDQNATALKATIQALEVQKMTLATLAGMNVNMSEIAKAFSVAMPAGMGAAAPSAPASNKAKSPQFSGLEVPATSYQPNPAAAPAAAAPAQPAAAAPGPVPSAGTSDAAAAADAKADAAPAASAGAAAVDPLQWWGALTQQFQSIAASALQEAAARSPIEPVKATAAARPASSTGAKTVAKKAVKKVVKTAVKKAPPKVPPKASPKAPSKVAGKTSGAAVKTASKASAARKGAARSR